VHAVLWQVMSAPTTAMNRVELFPPIEARAEMSDRLRLGAGTSLAESEVPRDHGHGTPGERNNATLRSLMLRAHAELAEES
jgi:hypothetical protein